MRLGLGLALTGAALLGGVVRPEILWDFTNPAAALPGFALTCPTTRTYTAQDGSIQTAAINEPRYDWTGGVRALLVEPGATTFVQRSSHTAAYPWAGGTSQGITATLVGTGFYGSVPYADFALTGTNANSFSEPFIGGAVSRTGAAIGQTWVASYYLRLISGVWPASARMNAQVIEENSSNAYITGAWSTITPTTTVQRTSQARTLSSASLANVRSAITMDGLGAAGATTFTGQVIRIFGWQLEQGPAPTSLIQSLSGAATTRAADTLASLSLSAIWAAAASVQGTVVVDVEAMPPNSASRGHLWSIDDAGNDVLAARAYLGGSSDDRAVLSAGNGASNSDLLITAALRGRQRIAVSYANGAQPMVSRNGGAVQTHPLVYAHNPANTALQSLFSNFNGRVRSLAVYRNAASAAQLQQMSVAA